MGAKPKTKVKHPRLKFKAIEKKIEQGKATPHDLEWRRDYIAKLAAKGKTPWGEKNSPDQNTNDVQNADLLSVETVSAGVAFPSDDLPESVGEQKELPPIDVTSSQPSVSSAAASGGSANGTSNKNSSTPSSAPTVAAKASWGATDEQKRQRDAAAADLIAQLQTQLMVGGPDFLGNMWADYVDAMNADLLESEKTIGESLMAFPQPMMDGLIRPCIRLTAITHIPPFDPTRVAPIAALGSTVAVMWQHRKYRKAVEKLTGKNQVTPTATVEESPQPPPTETPPEKPVVSPFGQVPS